MASSSRVRITVSPDNSKKAKADIVRTLQAVIEFVNVGGSAVVSFTLLERELSRIRKDYFDIEK